MAEKIDACSIEAGKVLLKLKKGLTEDQANKLMEDMRQAIVRKTRRAAVRNQGESAEEALINATEEFIDERLRDALNKKRVALIDLNRRVEVIDWIRKNFKDDPSLGLESQLTGVNRAIDEARFSADSEQVHLGNHYQTGVAADIKKLGLWSEFVKNIHEQDTMRAMELMGDPQADLSNLSPEAVKIAKILKKWNTVA